MAKLFSGADCLLFTVWRRHCLRWAAVAKVREIMRCLNWWLHFLSKCCSRQTALSSHDLSVVFACTALLTSLDTTQYIDNGAWKLQCTRTSELNQWHAGCWRQLYFNKLPASSESDSVHSTHYSQVPTITNHSTTVGWNKWNKTSAMNSRATRLFHILVIASHNLPQIIRITMTSVELYKKLSCQTQPHSIQCLHSHWSV